MTDTSLTSRDNLFGICAALGEDFGFNPLWLRIGFAVALLFHLEGVLLTYAGLGVLVAASRLLFPNRKPVRVPQAQPASDTAALEEEVEFRRAA